MMNPSGYLSLLLFLPFVMGYEGYEFIRKNSNNKNIVLPMSEYLDNEWDVSHEPNVDDGLNGLKYTIEKR